MLARPRADQDPAIFTPNEESRANPPEVEKIVASDELGIKSTERTGYVKVKSHSMFPCLRNTIYTWRSISWRIVFS